MHPPGGKCAQLAFVVMLINAEAIQMLGEGKKVRGKKVRLEEMRVKKSKVRGNEGKREGGESERIGMG